MERVIVLTIVHGRPPDTESVPVTQLRVAKEHARERAQTLVNARLTFNIYVASESDPNEIYLHVTNDPTTRRVRA